MNIRLVYSSLTGNTRRLAETMGDQLGIKAQNVRDVTALGSVDLLFVGSGVYGARPSRAMLRFLRGLPSLRGVKVALFGTYGASPHQLDRMARCVEEKGGEVLGRFSCRGRDWVALGLVARGHPSPAELEAAASFAKQIRERAENAAKEDQAS